jgi:vitamin B12 transporter
LIDFDYQDYVLKNIIKSSNKGIEVRYKLNMDEWDLMILMRSQDPEDNEGKQLLRRSKTSGSLTLTKDIYGYLGTINLSNFGKRKDFGDINLPSYSLLNLSVTKELNMSTKLSLKLENVLDKNYFTAAASNAFYLNQGRSIWFKLHYKLGK